ncbi:MAG: hypothetical protein SGPRY_013659 [Prymnesium sp.]
MLCSGAEVLIVTGAGLSAPSGVPTFRGEANSLWARFVLEYGTRSRFRADPLAWWNDFWLPAHTAFDPQTLQHKTFHPNPAHHALTSLAGRFPSLRLLTQNVDGLHLASGLKPEQMVEIHGRASLRKCIRAGCIYERARSIEAEPIALSRSDKGEPCISHLPLCPSCGEPCLPQVLLFDEMYDSHDFYEYRKATRWLDAAHAFVFVGTSFAVGITEHALSVAARKGAPVYNFNLVAGDYGEQAAELTGLNIVDIVGDCSVTLPKLVAAVEALQPLLP